MKDSPHLVHQQISQISLSFWWNFSFTVLTKSNFTIQCCQSQSSMSYVIFSGITQQIAESLYPFTTAAAAAESLQACPTLCDPRDGGPPGSPVPGLLQARTLEWAAISFSNAWKWKAKGKPLSRVRLCVTPWAAAHQAPPPMGFSRQEYWSGLDMYSSHITFYLGH